MNKIKFIYVFSFLIIVLSGCTTKTLPAYKIYNLDTNNKCCSYNYKKKNINIKIIEPITAKSLNSTAIYYSSEKYKLQTYKLSKWSDYPTKMLLTVLSSKLDNLNIYNNVMTSNIYAHANYILQSKLIEFKQVINNNNSNIILKMKFYLISSTNQSDITSKTFTYKIDTKKIDAKSSVIAFNSAVDLLINDLSSWLYKNTKEEK